jgi:hypothetical protein
MGEVLDEAQDRRALVPGHGVVLAGRAAGHPARDAGIAQIGQESFEGSKVDLARVVEGGDKRGEHAG